jgi:hypothetical protein
MRLVGNTTSLYLLLLVLTYSLRPHARQFENTKRNLNSPFLALKPLTNYKVQNT